MAKRYFEFSEGSSNKFWEVWMEGNQVFTRYGKIGATGQVTLKDEGSPAAAQKLHDKLVKEKTGKGYVEKGAGSGAAPAAAPPAPAPAKKTAAPAAAPAPKPPPAPAAMPTDGYRRFEFSEGSSNKFWEVKVDESTQLVRYGKIGTAGQETEKEFDSPGEAKSATKELIAEKVKKGYHEVGGKPKFEGNPELEAAIEKNLDDPNPYLVYGDWLQGKQEPVGELIALQVRAQTEKDADKAKELEKVAKAFIKKNGEQLLGPLAAWPERESKRYGESKRLNLEWHFGFIKAIDFGGESFDDGDGEDLGGLLAELLALPAARFVQKLSLGPIPGEEEMSLSPFIDGLEEAKGPRTLRELYLGNVGDWDISSTNTGDFGSVAALFPRLEKLTLHAGQLELGKGLSLPELRELNLQTGGLSTGNVKHVQSLDAPKLERLSLWFGMEDYGGDCGLKDIQWILSASGPAAGLKHLGIMNCEFVGEAVEALAKSKILKQLESLDLSMGCLADKDIDFMVAHQAAFAHLKHLELNDNGLSAASKPKVKGLAKDVSFGEEQDPSRTEEEGYRYVAVGE